MNDIEVDLISSERIYCGSGGFGFFKSTDAGFSWENMNTGLSDTVSVYKIETNDLQSNLNMFIVAHQRDSGGIFQNVNNNSWERIGIDERYISTIKLFNEKLYAGSNGIYVKQILTNVDENIQIPFSAKLYPNYPNPFNPITQIKYSIVKDGLVTLKVYDILGREVAVLVNEEKPAGTYKVEFNASNLSSGIYFYSITTGDFHQTKKMIVLK